MLPDGDPIKDIIEKLAKAVYDNTVSGGQVSPQLMMENARIMTKGAMEATGIDLATVEYGAPQNELIANIRGSIQTFSVAKSHAEIQEMSNLLINPETNEIKTFSQYKRDVLEMHETYNLNYLKAEYDHAVGQAQMAALWSDYERDQEAMPYLTYLTAGDGRVRDSHRALDGITRPVGDAFWSRYYPRNDWGCRCSVVQTNDKSKVTHKRTAEAVMRKVNLPPLFRKNVGKSQVMFERNHPYFQEMDLEPEEMKATDHYGMKAVDSIYGRTGRMKTASDEPFDTWWGKQSKWKDEDAVVMTDRNGNKLLFGKSVFDNSSDAVNLKDTIGTSSEIWKNAEGTVYLKYYKDRVILTEVDKNLKAIRYSSINPLNEAQTVEAARKGILMHR